MGSEESTPADQAKTYDNRKFESAPLPSSQRKLKF